VTLVGCVRVSTRDQHPEAQTGELPEVSLQTTFTDHASGTLARRPALGHAALMFAGDAWLIGPGGVLDSEPDVGAVPVQGLFDRHRAPADEVVV